MPQHLKVSDPQRWSPQTMERTKEGAVTAKPHFPPDTVEEHTKTTLSLMGTCCDSRKHLARNKAEAKDSQVWFYLSS